MFALLAVVVVVFLWWTSRQIELFCISVRHGKALVVRGRVPPMLLSDIRDVVSRVRAGSATIRAMKSEGGGRLVCSGDLGEDQKQQLRNVFSLYPIAQLRHAPLIHKPSLGQLLGIAWLAWMFDRRS